MKLALNVSLSLAMLALCTWLVWPDEVTRVALASALQGLQWKTLWPTVAAYLALSAIMHLGRAWRWKHLLAPLGASLPAGPLLAISSVGFLAILALPARLGELVRPGLIRRRAGISASAALGTVAVERVVDGLVVSLFVFGACLALRGPAAPSWMMPTAYAALGVFVAALGFLLIALRRPEGTIRWGLRLCGLTYLAPRLSALLAGKLRELIRGFSALTHGRSMVAFLAWTLLYWTANGLALWVLAQPLLSLSVVGALATMSLVAVGITLPNSPGLVGQFQAFTLLGLSLYLGPEALQRGTPLHAQALAFAIVHHASQVGWYLVMGAVGLATPWVSLAELRAARKVAPGSGTDDPGT